MPRAMITSLQPDAVEAGAEVLRAGGNSVDAALRAPSCKPSSIP